MFLGLKAEEIAQIKPNSFIAYVKTALKETSENVAQLLQYPEISLKSKEVISLIDEAVLIRMRNDESKFEESERFEEYLKIIDKPPEADVSRYRINTIKNNGNSEKKSHFESGPMDYYFSDFIKN